MPEEKLTIVVKYVPDFSAMRRGAGGRGAGGVAGGVGAAGVGGGLARGAIAGGVAGGVVGGILSTRDAGVPKQMPGFQTMGQRTTMIRPTSAMGAEARAILTQQGIDAGRKVGKAGETAERVAEATRAARKTKNGTEEISKVSGKAAGRLEEFVKSIPMGSKLIGMKNFFGLLSIGAVVGGAAIVALARKKGLAEHARVAGIATGFSQQAAGFEQLKARASAAGFAGNVQGDIPREFARSSFWTGVGRSFKELGNAIFRLTGVTGYLNAGIPDEDLIGGLLTVDSIGLQRARYFRNLSRNSEEFQNIFATQSSTPAAFAPTEEGAVIVGQARQNADVGFFMAQLNETWIKTANDAALQAKEMAALLRRINSSIEAGL